jgi:hypothetical protein
MLTVMTAMAVTCPWIETYAALAVKSPYAIVEPQLKQFKLVDASLVMRITPISSNP